MFGTLSDVTVDENAITTVTLSATDADGDAITFSLVSAPAFVTISGDILTIAPGYSDSGPTHAVTVRAADELHQTDATFNIVVNDVNRAPAITSPTSLIAAPGTPSTVQITATDPDGDPVTLTLGAAPSFVSLNGTTLTINAATTNVGSYTVDLTAADNRTPALSSTVTLPLTVTGPVSGTIVLAGGAKYTNSYVVVATLSASSNAGTVTQMRFSTDGTIFTNWTAYATSFNLTLPSGQGTKTVYVQFQDSAGNIATAMDTIILDTSGPLFRVSLGGGNTVFNTPTAALTLTLLTTEITSELTMYVTHTASSFAPNVSSATFTPFTASSTASIAISPDGAQYLWVFLKDGAGNLSSQSYAYSYDTGAPTVLAAMDSPAAGATNVSPTSRVSVTFSEPIAPSSLNAANLTITPAVTVALRANGSTVTLIPAQPLAAGSYTVSISGVTDLAGNAMASAYTFSFTTSNQLILSGPSRATFNSPVSATTPAGTMVVTAATAGSNNALYWAFNDGSSWTSGQLGAGTNVVLSTWGNKFVAKWTGLSTSEWAIFDQGAWYSPNGTAPQGRFVGNSLGLLDTYPQCASSCSIRAQLFDGTAWKSASPWGTIESDRNAAFIYNGTPSIAATSNEFAIAYTRFNAGGYWGATARFDGSAWVDGPTISSSGAIVASQSTFMAVGTGTVYVLNRATGNWDSQTISGSQLDRAASNGTGFLVAMYEPNIGDHVRIYDGTQWLTSTAAQLDLPNFSSVVAVAGTGSKWTLASNASGALSIRTFDGSSWSSAYQGGTMTNGDYGSCSASLASSSTVVTCLINGAPHAYVNDGSGWQDVATLQGTGQFTGGLTTVSAAGSPWVLLATDKSWVRRQYQSGSTFGAPTASIASAISGSTSNVDVAFASNGKGLAVWDQTDVGVTKIYGAFFDGSAWQTAVKLADAGDHPRVATNGSTWAVLYEARGSTAVNYALVTFTEAGGAGTPAVWSTLNADTWAAHSIASNGTGFLVMFSAQNGTSTSLMYSTSATGAAGSFSTPVARPGAWVAEANLNTGIPLVGNSAGYMFLTYANSSWYYNATFTDGTTFGTATSFYGPYGVTIGASPTQFAVTVVDQYTTVSTSIYSGGAWGATPGTFQGGDKYADHPVVAGSASGFRVFHGPYTREYASGSWGATVATVTGMKSEWARGTSTGYCSAGRVHDNTTGFDALTGYSGSSGSFAVSGALEGTDSYMEAAALGAGAAACWAAWPQRDPGTGELVIYGKSF